MSTVYNVNGYTYYQWRAETDNIIKNRGYDHLIESVKFDWEKRFHAGQKAADAVDAWIGSLTLDLL